MTLEKFCAEFTGYMLHYARHGSFFGGRIEISHEIENGMAHFVFALSRSKEGSRKYFFADAYTETEISSITDFAGFVKKAFERLKDDFQEMIEAEEYRCT